MKIDHSKVSFTSYGMMAEVKVTNTEKPVGETEKSSDKTKANAGTTGVKTGDDTSVLPYMLLLLAAALLEGIMLVYKKRKNKGVQ